MSSRERLVVAFANGAVLGGGLLLVESQCYQTIEEDEMKQVSSITFLKGVISPSHSKIIFRVLSGKSSKTTKNSIFWCIYGCALHVPGPTEGEKFPVIALDYQHRRSASALFLWLVASAKSWAKRCQKTHVCGMDQLYSKVRSIHKHCVSPSVRGSPKE